MTCPAVFLCCSKIDIGKFKKFVTILGEGAYARVIHMKSRKTGKDFALKVVSKKLKARIAVGELTPELAHMVMDGSLSLGEAQQIAVSTPHDTALREADSQKRWCQPLRRRRAQSEVIV